MSTILQFLKKGSYTVIKWNSFQMQGWFNLCKSVNVTYQINRMRNKHQMVISIDPDKASKKIQQPFMIKILKLGTEGTYLHILKAKHNKPTANILSGERLKVFL